jgi:transposase-like protein
MIAAAGMAQVGSTLRDDVEVPAKAQRRRFTAKYKRDILREADACREPGALGALLRREGLYSSHLASWRKQRNAGELAGLAPKKRGRKAVPPDPRDRQIAEQRREIGRLTARAERAEALVEVQKKLAQLLGTTFESEKP